MAADPIRAALEAAAEACQGASHMCATGDLAALNKCLTTKAWQPCRCRRQAIAAVAAFHRSMAADDTHMRMYHAAIAAAVEAAAQERDAP